MKSTDRHRLKENEFAHTVARTREAVDARKRELTMGVTIAVVVMVVGGGYFTYRNSRDNKATPLLANAHRKRLRPQARAGGNRREARPERAARWGRGPTERSKQ